MTPPRSLAAASGACFGAGAGGLVAANLRAEPALFLAAGAILGALLAARRPDAPALAHPWLAALAAACAALVVVAPEPAFFLLVPLVVASCIWPFAPVAVVEGDRAAIPRAMPSWALPALFAAAAAIFFLQSAGRYWDYGAGSKDLGLFYQTHWLIAHGLPPLNTVMGMHALADHMELLDYVVAPLLRIHDGPETLLLVQSLAAASAVFPLGWMGLRVLESSRTGLALALLWVLAPDLHAGVMFDYNPMLLGGAALLWVAWALLCRGWVACLVTALAASLSREDVCLYVAVVAAVLALRGAPRPRALGVAALALLLFAFEVTVLFPRFRAGGFRHWEQFAESADAAEGATVSRLAPTLVDHPQKRRSILQPLAATGFLGLADPLSIALQVPNWVERFFSSHQTRWWGYHYGVPAAATALVGAILGMRRLRTAGRDGPGMAGYAAGCALVIGLLPPYSTPALREDRVRRSELYLRRVPYAMAEADVRTANAAVRFIGRNPYTVVAAQDRLLPHLAGRRTILMLDRAPEAEVVALQLNGATWPDGRRTWRGRVRALWATGAFGVAFCEGRTVVLRRGAASVPCPPWDEFLASFGQGGERTSDASQPAETSTVAPAPTTHAVPAASAAPTDRAPGTSTPGARNR